MHGLNKQLCFGIMWNFAYRLGRSWGEFYFTMQRIKVWATLILHTVRNLFSAGRVSLQNNRAAARLRLGGSSKLTSGFSTQYRGTDSAVCAFSTLPQPIETDINLWSSPIVVEAIFFLFFVNCLLLFEIKKNFLGKTDRLIGFIPSMILKANISYVNIYKSV